jgi:hypothetical protein
LVLNDVQFTESEPVAAGRFGEVWKGRMSGQKLIAVKVLRVYATSDVEKLLKVSDFASIHLSSEIWPAGLFD